MLLSIIIPVYNGKNTLSNLVEPLLEIQRNDIEFILVDDGSKDNSYDIIEEYSKKDSRVKPIHIENSGVSVARNTGLKVAIGKYIYFCDCDDYVFTDTLEKFFILLETDFYNIIFSDYIYKFLESNKTVRPHIDITPCTILDKPQICELIIAPLILKTSTDMASLWNKFFLSDTIKNNNIEFNPKIHKGEDWQFILRFLEHCQTAYYLPEVLYEYRLDGSQSETKYKREPGTHQLFSIKLKHRLLSSFNFSIEDNKLNRWYASAINELIFAAKSCIQKDEWNCMINDSFVQLSAKKLLRLKSKECLRLEISRKYKIYSLCIVLKLNKFLRFLIRKTNERE